jgi:hypothetical protein
MLPLTGKPGLDNDLLHRLLYAIEAPFNSYAKQASPSCLPNTRLDLLKEIHKWVDGQDERCIFWLNGLAGTGKSTIARTVARTYFEQKRLRASFFFSKVETLLMLASSSQALLCSLRITHRHSNVTFPKLSKSGLTLQTSPSVTSGASYSSVLY